MSNNIRTKFMSKRGETLLECLLAISLIVLASTIFLRYAAVSHGMMAGTDDRMEAYYRERAFMEGLTVDESAEGLITVSEGENLRVSVKKASDAGWKTEEISVTVYSGDNLAIYQLEDER